MIESEKFVRKGSGWPKRLSTAREAVRFIEAAGFCLLFPAKNVPLPSLYFAAERRWPPVWDEMAKRLWRWKDELPRKRRAFYAKYFKGRGTFISLEFLPHFLAMRDSAAAPGDSGWFYDEGRITAGARAIWEAIAKEGPLATLELRQICKMGGKAGNARFKKAALELQCLLILAHFGAEQETQAWASNRFELISRAFPEQVREARRISAKQARACLARKYRSLYPASTAIQVARLFGWPKTLAEEALCE